MPKGQPPPQHKPDNDAGYLEEITKSVFRSGFSWQVIENKWPNFLEAFARFDLDAVAAFNDDDLERLLSDTGIVRNGRKIEATIKNARTMQALREEFGSFHAYLRSLDDLDYPKKSKELQKQFSHLGRTGTFTFLWCVAEPVPDWEER
jgi:3-methyladenine DNA glycosylase Tag